MSKNDERLAFANSKQKTNNVINLKKHIEMIKEMWYNVRNRRL